MLESFFIDYQPANIEKGTYLPPLVVLSYLVASFASYTALSLAQQLAGAASAREKSLLFWGGAFAMGAGIWSMHFIGMLSYKMDMKITYDPFLTLLSMAIAIGFSLGVLKIVGRDKLNFSLIIFGGIVLGIGICSMHYTGMAAMDMDGDLRYMPRIFFLSVAIAIAASAAALWIAFTLARTSSEYHYIFQLVAALIMGAAISGMHYTGMAASVFIPWADCRYDPNQDFSMLAVSIAIVTGIILFMALMAGTYKRKRTEFQLSRYMRELEESNRSLDDFVHMVSHDLKEPVRGIMNFTHFILEDYEKNLDNEGKKQLRMLSKLAQRMDERIADLLHFARVKRKDFSFVETNLQELVTKVLDLLNLQIKENNAAINVGKLPVIHCDPSVSEVFHNLIINAIKYNDEEKKIIDVGYTTNHPEHKGENVYYIRDNGIGISPEFRDTVFEMFKRLHGHDEYGGGTGSGLAIVRQIIERHNGKIWIENNDGKGSAFYFTLSNGESDREG